MGKRSAAVLAPGILLVGCATSDHFYMVPRQVTCLPFAAPVEFLREPPDRPYVEIARVEASGRFFIPVSWETLRFRMCFEALEVEADAVLGPEQERVGYSFGLTPFKFDWVNKRLVGTAIRYLDPGEQPEEIEAPPVTEKG